MIRRVVLVGPESTGKTTLAAELAERYATVAVPEFLRTWVAARGAVDIDLDDTVAIARGQAADEDAQARIANRLLVCDTDAITSVVYSQHYLGAVHADVAALAGARRPDLTFLLAPDVPWVADPQRDRPHLRWELYEAFRATLVDYDRPHVVISGDWDARRALAVAAIDALLALPQAVAPS